MKPASSNGNPADFLPLPPATFHIMLALADGERHGYSIMQEVTQRTDGAFKLGPGSLYGSIKKMVEAGWIEETDARPDPGLDDERRRYYKLTQFGERVLRAEASRLSALVNIARERGLVGGNAS
ncbi:MAG TPA: PadR family transcriptional regulator [Phototrophicaceae bacterium]|jgi:DNA-binding PadR family transcriptional regulator|nr:PadR family transcriptional regulator [Phototrophicaceae bacterium]